MVGVEEPITPLRMRRRGSCLFPRCRQREIRVTSSGDVPPHDDVQTQRTASRSRTHPLRVSTLTCRRGPGRRAWCLQPRPLRLNHERFHRGWRDGDGDCCFSPEEVANCARVLKCEFPGTTLDDGYAPLAIPLNGKVLRPWCHFELPESDISPPEDAIPASQSPAGRIGSLTRDEDGGV